MANLITRSVSMPKEVFAEIDDVARDWYTNRSQALIRIYQEWKKLTQHQTPAPGLIGLSSEATAHAAKLTAFDSEGQQVATKEVELRTDPQDLPNAQ